jgi:hypothetical protein
VEVVLMEVLFAVALFQVVPGATGVDPGMVVATTRVADIDRGAEREIHPIDDHNPLGVSQKAHTSNHEGSLSLISNANVWMGSVMTTGKVVLVMFAKRPL